MYITKRTHAAEVNVSQPRKSQVVSMFARHFGARASGSLVRGALPEGSLARVELQRDLGLEPLDVVLFVLSFKESDDMAFRIEDLEHVVTAGDLVDTVAGWLEQYDRDERLADEEELAHHAGAA
jgi:hypothetical protein